MIQKNPSGKLFSSAAEDVRHAQEPHHCDQSRSPAYRLAYDDLDFVLRDELRPARMLLELTKPELGLQGHGIEHTVVMFGSAHTIAPEVAQGLCNQLEQQLSPSPSDVVLRADFDRAQTQLRYARYYEQAREFGRIVAPNCQLHGQCVYVDVTGGGPGIM